MDKVVIIYGPTAVGKSAVAVEVAKKLDGEIISADSMQIYKYLNIGSAKVTQEEMCGIPHHLIDIRMPNEDYSAAEFANDANKLIYEIIQRGKTPIIVGGTGLYIKGLLDGYSFGNVNRHEEFRKSLKDLSNDEIYNLIKQKDIHSVVDENNRHRLIRRLEILTFSEEATNDSQFKYPYVLIGLCDDRQLIYNRINNRVNRMIDEGLLEELDYILSLNISQDAQCLKAIGYKEFVPYKRGEKTLQECTELLKQKTRNYAKRQFTFMNQFKNIIKVNFIGVEKTAEKICKIAEDNNE